MKKILLCLAVLFIFLGAASSPAEAARKRVIKGSTGYVAVSLRRDRLAVLFSLFNLSRVTEASYSLSYLANGIPQGVSGTITPSGQNSTNRQLLFGTCSKNVCTYHRNITDARLSLTFRLKSGGTLKKSYRLKV
ncbi:hypothetical protein FJZ40_04315 [Candidatus Shapirobacteria bacterium]|nr:hypothetical protein [Candidatus Shapirobacteria bacterium]